MLILPETPPGGRGRPGRGAANARHVPARSRIAGDQTIKATISIGIAGGRGSELQLDMLVDRADAAMYAAKSLGRNRVYLFRELDEESLVRRAPISADAPGRRPPPSASWASDTATQALASVLAPQPHHRGRPSDMIASLATGIALEMGLPHEEIERIRIASLLHDLGQDRDPRGDPRQALDAVGRRVAGDRRASAHRPGHPRAGLEPARGDPRRAPPPRALQRRRLPARPARAARSRSARGSSRSPMRITPWSTTGRTARRSTTTKALDELRDQRRHPVRPDGRRGLLRPIYGDAVPPDGLEEVYRLHERARGGLPRLDNAARPACASAHERDAAARSARHRRRARGVGSVGLTRRWSGS